MFTYSISNKQFQAIHKMVSYENFIDFRQKYECDFLKKFPKFPIIASKHINPLLYRHIMFSQR